MYVKRIRLEIYGPVTNPGIALPFEGGRPKPVVVVGATAGEG